MCSRQPQLPHLTAGREVWKDLTSTIWFVTVENHSDLAPHPLTCNWAEIWGAAGA